MTMFNLMSAPHCHQLSLEWGLYIVEYPTNYTPELLKQFLWPTTIVNILWLLVQLGLDTMASNIFWPFCTVFGNFPHQHPRTLGVEPAASRLPSATTTNYDKEKLVVSGG